MEAALSTARQLSFDYGDMPKSDATALEKHADAVLEIQERQRKSSVENALALGAELAAAQKRLSNHGNGTFGKWVSERCGLSKRTAYYLVTLNEQVGAKDRAIVAQSFDLTALYRLLSDSCPEEAYRDALKLAKKGEKITAKRAKEIAEEYIVNSQSDDDYGDDQDLGTDFDAATAATEVRKFIKRTFSSWPKSERQFLINQLMQIAKELNDPNLLEAESIE